MLKTFLVSANANDPNLFPLIKDNPELRARAVAKAIKELKRLPTRTKVLKSLISETLSKFDVHRVAGQAQTKKSRIDPKSAEASAFQQFVSLVPYLELSYPQQTEGPSGAPKNSLLSLYWKMHQSAVEEPLLQSRKYWE